MKKNKPKVEQVWTVIPDGKRPPHPPIVVESPDFIAEKMRAITAIAETNRMLAVALSSVNTHVTVSGCTITSTDGGTAISVE